ncbi:2,3-bisphosphoglycerate-independent phosphoglycerate mutase [Candidatus Pseudomonas adelgestsugas]|uniref:2,3-bisphosphoglycerate-independent phosphoglycerate mutase n=1 Tax=Candidatus Pseudomonas adelgestsugas TaxID=1302376 RepID=A0ABX5R7A9_9PSED|nr:2,3-bisphosphoglycerate-independent phosphoglycerate mutase [Candidatus Pseudomonas adelgestsugas]QAX81530.1 2,3-bisphosphoglycerate-independent phosphoglycerate mutase [Candidatus Pseudomonas adelgestsugas]
MTTPKPLVLIILDGFGHSENHHYNAVYLAKTPVLDHLIATAPSGLLSSSGMDVGLPEGQVGNSEVGHMTLGTGRVVYQNFTRVTEAIHDGKFFENPIICAAVDKAVAAGKAVHVMGLLSDGGVHSHQNHLVAMAKLAFKRGTDKIYLHAFLDGRDTPPKSARSSIELLDTTFATLGKGHIASMIGRYFAMDRNNYWDRVAQAYNLIVDGQAEFNSATAQEGLQAAYVRGESDEFVKATTIGEPVQVENGDAVVFMNFRSDRARELSYIFVNTNFKNFERARQPKVEFVMLTKYATDIHAPAAFEPDSLKNVLGDYLSKNGKTQLRIAETEKYAHVTFFFSGGREEPFPGEERILIQSPKVATYDLQPEMSALEVTNKIINAIKYQHFDMIVVNYANSDMVGHSGNLKAAVKAVEFLDLCIGRIVDNLKKVGGEALITADHGNCERMSDKCTGQPHTAHTAEPVPFIYIGKRNLTVRKGGVLADVAPTILKLMGLKKPKEMTGTSILI